MEISKDENIFNVIETQNNLQLEDNNQWIIDIYNKDTVWTEREFNNFISVMRSFKYKEEIGKQYLEVISNENILKINNISNIIKYCSTEKFKELDFKWLKRKQVVSEDIDDLFDVLIKMSVYNETENIQPENWDDIRKKYKIIMPISYEDKNGTIYRVNIIKENDEEFNTFKQSGVIKQKQQYEFQLIINKKEVVLQSIIKLLQSISLSSLILSKQQQNKVIEDYGKLIKDDIVVRKYIKKGEEVKPPLLTPKPSTLERKNMIDPSEYGAISILSEYTVTEKADGERILMYINNNGNVYLINNSYNVEDTGIKASKELYNSLIDGEYITCNKRKDESNKSLYASFDIYYINGKKVTHLPLIDKKENRYDILKKTKSLLNDSKSPVEYIVKKHYYSEEILKDCNEILSNEYYPYDIDGLIFTPAKLAVYSYYANKPVQITDNMSWDRVFKWKPVEQNTIDFLVREGRIIVKNGKKYKELELSIGYNATQWEEITPTEGLKIRYDKERTDKYRNQRKEYIPKPFKPTIYYENGVQYAHIEINNKGEIRADNGDIIDNLSIVEFSYILDKSKPINERWVAKRVREDKTRIYKTGVLGKTANDLKVAINVWRSIHLPVTHTMIVGKELVYSKDAPDDIENRLLDTDDIYYSREIPRDSLLSVNMLNFHNLGIKRDLYMKPKKKGTLLELACGQGGDMNRWIDAGYNFILGIDLVKNNIYNPRSGAYSRVINRFLQYKKKEEHEKIKYTDMAFAVGDCGINIKDGSAAMVLDDKDSANILKKVLNKQGNNVDKHLRHIAGRGAGGFDVVSCMFAIHYFFQSEQRLDGFLGNVSSNLKKGGMFIATFMDGKSVEEAIENNDGNKIEGRKNISYNEDDNKSVPVWAIIRRYNKEEKSKYSKQIDVYIENTQKLIPEFLVNYELLVEKCKLFNLVIHETEMFGESFYKIKNQEPQNEETKIELHKNINLLDEDEIQKKFSFLNRWVIFKKI